jgi:recombination protein RecT
VSEHKPETALVKSPVARLQSILAQPSVQEQFENALKDNRNTFIASLIDIYSSDKYLQQCNPTLVIREALKAAVLQLPLTKSLGHAWIIPYKGVPQFQLGYRGFVQLAMRSGQYRFLNADVVYEGELKGTNRLTGLLDLTGEKKSDKVVGYFAYLELLNGFTKAIYWDRERVIEHAKRFSQAYKVAGSPWHENFDAMALKTVLKRLLATYGILSVEMQQAFTQDTPEEELSIRADAIDAEHEVIDVTVESEPEPTVEPETVAEPAQEPNEQPNTDEQPELFDNDKPKRGRPRKTNEPPF